MKASELRDETNNLASRLADTSERLTDVEVKVDDEDRLIRAALERASEAQSTAQSAYDKVQRALESVRDISLALENLDQISKQF